MIWLAVTTLGLAAAFVLNTWIVARETRKTFVRGINVGGRAMGAAEDIIKEEDLAEARRLDDLTNEVS